jgi:CRP-like cAMP-binding protein
MDEGVDPKDMCQSLVNKVARSEQLQAVADPDVLVLFEDWLEELEAEVIAIAAQGVALDPQVLGEKLGVSYAGASFLIIKLKTEGKL